jgi:hypothetical protein
MQGNRAWIGKGCHLINYHPKPLLITLRLLPIL